MEKAVIDNRGLIVPKKILTLEQIKKIKSELTVSPETTFGNFQVKEYPIFRETKETLILPVHHPIDFLKNFETETHFPETKIKFPENNISLRLGAQTECYSKIKLEKDKAVGGGIIGLQTGGGKCLAIDTTIILNDGSIKKVQDIKVGDLLLSETGVPEQVLSTCTGTEEMFTISYESESFTCNASHILSLKNNINIENMDNNCYDVNYFCPIKKQIVYKRCKTFHNAVMTRQMMESIIGTVDISVRDYIYSNCKLKIFRRELPTNWETKEMMGSEYIIGLKLSTMKILKISQYNLTCDKKQRLMILAGIIDYSPGKTDYKDIYSARFNYLTSAKDTLFLARSLGFKTSMEILENCYIVKIIGYYSENHIVPLKIKKVVNLKKCCNSISFDITPIYWTKQYYGFTLNGKQRFILEDFIVTHNTVLAIKTIADFSMKTLIVVNKIELMKQWKAELTKFIPGIKIGNIQGKTFEHQDCHVVIGMVQSISMKKELTSKDFDWVNVCIIDEMHGIASEVFSKIMFKVRPKFLFGLSATIERKDKMEKILNWYMGEVLYSDNSDKLKQSSEIHTYKYFGESSKEETLRDGTAAVSSMLSNIAEDEERTLLLVKILKELSDNPERCILVISDRTVQLKNLHKHFPENSGLFIGSQKADKLIEAKEKQILLGTYGMCNEGFSLAKLNCLVFATPRSSITQAIGRIFRKRHDNITPIIVDIVDDFSIFKGQSYRRKKIYRDNIVSPIFISKKNDGSIIKKEISIKDLEEQINVCLIDSESEPE